MVRIVGYSWVGIYAEDFEATIGFFTDKLGLTFEWREEGADFAGLRLPSGRLLEAMRELADYSGRLPCSHW